MPQPLLTRRLAPDAYLTTIATGQTSYGHTAYIRRVEHDQAVKIVGHPDGALMRLALPVCP